MTEERPSAFQRFNNWHFIYIIIILVMIILLVITHRGYQCENLVTVIGFGATLSSIILSVLAIFITFISNESNHKLREGLHGLSEIPGQIKKSISDTIDELKKETVQMKNASQKNLESQLNTNDYIKQSLDGFFSRIDKNYDDHNKKIEGIHEELISKIESMKNTPTDDLSMLSDEQIASFVTSIPVLQKALCVAINKLYSRDIKDIDISRFIDVIGYDKHPELGMYFMSCVIILKAMRLWTFTDFSIGDTYKLKMDSISAGLVDYLTKHEKDLLGEKEKDSVDIFVNELTSQISSNSSE